MNTAFVTGATGFVGSTLVDDLINRGYKVKCAMRKSSNLRWLKDKNVELCEVDLFDIDSIKKAMEGCNYIFHLAGVLFAQSEKEFVEGNIRSTENMIRAAKELNIDVKRFVYVSTIIAAGVSKTGKPMVETDECTPFTWYGISKYESEKVVLRSKDTIPVTIIRPGAVYGPRDYAMFASFKLSKTGINILLGEKGKLGSVIHVSDLSQGIIDASVSENTLGEVYFLANDDFIQQEGFGETIIKAMGKTPKNIIIPYGTLKVASHLSEFYGKITKNKALLNQQKLLELREPYIICSNEKAKRDFNFKQNISLIDGIKSTLQWYKENKWL